MCRNMLYTQVKRGACCLAKVAGANLVARGVPLHWLLFGMSEQQLPCSPQQGVCWDDMARQSGGVCVLPGKHRQCQPMLPRSEGLQRHSHSGELLL